MNPGNLVRFRPSVVARVDNDHRTANALGIVVSVPAGRSFARVDWLGTWIAAPDGSTVRAVPLANLERIPDPGSRETTPGTP